jgi:CRP/FNR family cyclic AMP-dependent transcriptional regulator
VWNRGFESDRLINSPTRKEKMSIKARFQEPSALIEALRAQKIIQGDLEVAVAIAEAGELVEFGPGKNLIEQGASDRDVFFLLAGKVCVIINGIRLYSREKNVTVGEMSAVNASITRSATIQADETTVAFKVSHRQLEAAADRQPRLWRLLAVDLAGRLEQRNKFINRANKRPRVFLISSAEALEIAEYIRAALDHEDVVVEIWSDEKIFPPSGYPIEALEQAVNECDFGIAIAQPDDLVRSRHRQSAAPRDNVIFELGFFMSRLGRARTVLLVPRGENVTLPSDFKGLTPLHYKTATEDLTMSSALGPTVYRIKELIRDLGVRKSLVEAK